MSWILIEEVSEPYPMKRRIPLSRAHWEIAQYWCYEKNCGYGPEDFSYGSNVKAWWYCVFDKQHVFQQTIYERVRAELESTVWDVHGCPYCASRRVSATNSLQACAPAVAAQWHPSKNGELRPQDVIAQSDQKAWWLCPACKLTWRARIASRVANGTSCPYCASRKVASFNSLRKLFPKVASEWHREKNKGLTPDQIMASSNQLVWWQCKKFPEHEWRAKVVNRTSANKTGCPCCTGRKVSHTNSLQARFPELAREWHPVRNGKLKPQDVTGKSKKIVWWRCPIDSRHEWERDVCARSSLGRGCPYCAGRKVDDTNSLAALYPELADEWHPKNGKLTPADVTDGSTKLVWWRCAKDKSHEWKTTPCARTSRGNGCPFCVGQKVSATNSLNALFPKLAKEWHLEKNGSLTPADVTTGSNKKIWWRCGKDPRHEWQAVVRNRSSNGSGCPICRPWRGGPK